MFSNGQSEGQVLRHFVRGESAGTIAALLGVSERTVETHAAHIRQKLQVRSILIAAVYVTAVEVDRQPVPPYELSRPKQSSSERRIELCDKSERSALRAREKAPRRFSLGQTQTLLSSALGQEQSFANVRSAPEAAIRDQSHAAASQLLRSSMARLSHTSGRAPHLSTFHS